MVTTAGAFDPNKSVLVYRPVEFLHKPNPVELHMTLIYIANLFESENVAPAEELLRILREGGEWSLNQQRRFVTADIAGAEAFGPDKNIPVLTLKVGESVESYRAQRAKAFEKNGISGGGNFYYQPHVTVPLEDALKPPVEVLLKPLEMRYLGEDPVLV